MPDADQQAGTSAAPASSKDKASNGKAVDEADEHEPQEQQAGDGLATSGTLTAVLGGQNCNN